MSVRLGFTSVGAAIHAFLISLSWDAYNKQQAAPKN
jgi:hypothetical protein